MISRFLSISLVQRTSAVLCSPHGIVSARMKWMAAQDSSRSEINSSKRAILVDRLQGVLGTSRRESAGRWKYRRNEQPVGSYKKNQNNLHCSPAFCRNDLNSISNSA